MPQLDLKKILDALKHQVPGGNAYLRLVKGLLEADQADLIMRSRVFWVDR